MAFGNGRTVTINAIYSLIKVLKTTAFLTHLLPSNIGKYALPERVGHPYPE